MYEMEHEKSLPENEHYIQAAIVKSTFKIAVTMYPRLAKHVHIFRFLCIDTTFKWVLGELNAWTVAGFSEEKKCRESSISLL